MAARIGYDIHHLRGIEILFSILSLLAISAAWAQQTEIGKAGVDAPSAYGARSSGAWLRPPHHPSPATQAGLANESRETRSASAALGLPSAGLVLSGTYSAGCLPETIAVGDLNNDGRPDLVVADWYLTCTGVFGTGRVSVLLGNGDGTFQEPVAYSSGGFQALSVAIGDLNGDGKPDLVVTNSCAGDPSGNCANGGTGQIGVLLGHGDGSFETAVSYSSGGLLAHATVIADVNGDGHPDVIVGNSCAQDCNHGSVGVLLGSGDGTLQAAVAYAGGDQYEIASLAVGDLNGDGHLDVVIVGGEDTGVVGVLMGNGDGTFQPQFSYPWGGYEPNSVVIGDVNGDGRADVVVASYCENLNGACDQGSVGVLLGNGDGTLQAPVRFSSGGSRAVTIAMGDINNDGNPDLIVAGTNPSGSGNRGPGEVGVLLGTGDGSFQAALVFPSGGTEPSSIVVADVNGDGKPDVLLTNFCDNKAGCDGMSPGTVGLLLNNAEPSQTATTTALISSRRHSIYGQSVTLTATVSSPPRSPAGTVIFYEGSASLGSATLVGRRAAVSVVSLGAGSHQIIAVYQGSRKFAPSTSGPLNQLVQKASTTATLASSKNPMLLRHAVTYTVTVNGRYGGPVSGTVTFRDGGTTVATETLLDDQATYRTAYPLAGMHTITAIYSGDANNGGSGTASLIQAIKAATTTVVTTSGSPSLTGHAVTFTATVSSTYGPIPDGEPVAFYNNGNVSPMGTGTTVNSTASFTTNALAAGTHVIKATYAGDATFHSSSGKVTEVVENP